MVSTGNYGLITVVFLQALSITRVDPEGFPGGRGGWEHPGLEVMSLQVLPSVSEQPVWESWARTPRTSQELQQKAAELLLLCKLQGVLG